ncbi:transcriptional regulator Kaiso [Betta splendens]|uniref:Transcriptional regulator Kaiso n=1 Tax=Betta splendens TaxID=158456 RepID=A0A6P7NKC5_BETSP|nr:transcriptional regulator Kaiso [Betta splendens]
MPNLKLISATDTQYPAAVLKSMNEQRNHGLFCDVTIIIQDKKFRAHKTILSASSSYFQQLFCVAGQVIELNFIRAEIFEQILNYIYSAKIIRVRSDLLEELISAGQILGVKFIANLGSPLSQVKGLPGLSKDAESKSDPSTELMPIITESFSISAEEFNQSSKSAGDDEDSDNDVMFVSQTKTPTKTANKEGASSEVIDLDTADSENVESKQSQDSNSSVTQKEDAAAPLKKCAANSPSISCPKPSLPDGSHLHSPSSTSNSSSSPARVSPATVPATPAASSSFTPEPSSSFTPEPSSSFNSEPSSSFNPEPSSSFNPEPSSSFTPEPSSSFTPKTSSSFTPKTSSSFTPKTSSSFTPETLSSFTHKTSSAPQASENGDILGVHKKQISVSAQPGDFNTIRLHDVSKSPISQANVPNSPLSAKKTVTLNTATEIASISSGCKVYANIGENTYDIVPLKEDPGEGGSKVNKGKRSVPLKPFEKTPTSPKANTPKKSRTDLEDHYELVMDGKTFYVCIVCKRPYVCLTSLRRHFNTHSWEKKYPCHYCNKVFALAEYRTKHEIHHTGERRYQCLLCDEMFLNYQLISTHCKQVHNQDPSGRKEKDDADNNLYRLLPCKTVQMKAYSWSKDGPGVPLISEDGSVHRIATGVQDVHSSTQSRMLNWDDIFVEPEAHMGPGAHSHPGSTINSPPQGATEFDFIIPETY